MDVGEKVTAALRELQLDVHVDPKLGNGLILVRDKNIVLRNLKFWFPLKYYANQLATKIEQATGLKPAEVDVEMIRYVNPETQEKTVLFYG